MWEKAVAAIEQKNVAEVKQMLRQAPELAVQKNYQDETLLHFAASIGSPEIVADLLVRGSKPDIPDEFGWTPLHEACGNGNEAIVAMFLQLPFNLEGVSRQGETALHLATRQGFAKVVQHLLQAGANYDFRNREGNTPLHVAALNGRLDIMQMLHDAGADIEARNLNGETPLHSTARAGEIEAGMWCLAHGADANDQDKGFRTFIDTAIREGRQLFVGHFARLDQPIPTPDTPNPLAATGIRLDVTINIKTMATQARQPGGKLFRAYLFCMPYMTRRMMLSALLEAFLWFIVFPFVVFMLFSGLAQGLIPRLFHVPADWAPPHLIPFVEAGLNTFLFFLASHLLTTPPEAGRADRNFIRRFRSTVWVRTLHFFIPAAFVVRSLSYAQPFWQQLSLFWLWYLMLYGITFIAWWVSKDQVPEPVPPPTSSGSPLRPGSSRP